MKSCPQCQRTFEDTLTFCLVDGSVLSAPYQPETTQVYPAAKAGDTLIAPPPRPTARPEATPDYYPKKPGGKRGLMIGLGVVLLIGVIVAVGWSTWFGGNKQPPSENSTNRTFATAEPNATPASTPQSTPAPKSTPALLKRIDLTGTWTGTFANREAMLFINSQDGDSFSGILKNSKGAIVAVSGSINRETRQISFQETRVIESVVEGPEWVLGSNSGSLSSDGAKMSGRGKDRVGHVYTWSFTK